MSYLSGPTGFCLKAQSSTSVRGGQLIVHNATGLASPAHSLFYKDRIQQKYGMPIEAWEAKTGRKLEDCLYRGTLGRGGHVAGCGCAAGEDGKGIPIQPITGT